jgi:hypothetical protein
MVVAVVALLAALNGPAIAQETATIAKAISGKSIKPNSIPGNRLVNDSVTGKQVKESTLATVPSATNATNALNAGHASTADNAGHASTADNASHAASADNASHAANADHATSADSTNGIKLEKIYYTTAGVDTTPVVIFHDGGLSLTATCPAGDGGGTTKVVAGSDVNDAEIDGSVAFNSTSISNFQDFDFDTTDSQDIEDYPSTGSGTDGYDSVGHLVYANQQGNVVSITYQFDSNNSFGQSTEGHKFCDFTGIAQVS